MDNRPLKVLLVDDDEEEYLIIGELLSEIKDRRYELEWVTSYNVALAKIKLNEHHVCLLDYFLGEANGLELLREAIKSGCKMPLIMLTGHGDPQVDIDALEIGAADYLSKNEIGASLLDRTIRYAIKHRQLLQAVSESELKYRRIFELSPEAIVLIDRKGNILDVNRRLEDWLGYKPDQVIGSNIIEVPFLSVENRDKAIEKLSQRVSGIKIPTYELEFITKDGKKRVGEIEASLIVDENGEAIQEIVMISDITERKEMERMKDEFISMISHEIRTPLTSIHLSLGLLAGRAAGELPEQARELVDLAHANSKRLANLINDVLDFDKLESGMMKLDLQPLELTALAKNAIEENIAYAEQFGVEFVLESPLPHARVNADKDRLMQVFTNLLSNAAKFSPPDDTVLISIVRAGEALRVNITDHGSGIPESFHDRIFQKFAQADSSDTRQSGGTGLGLSIAKAIIERHGGRIGFETEIDRGTTFYFELPEWRTP